MLLKTISFAAAFLVAVVASWFFGDGPIGWPQPTSLLVGNLFVVLATLLFWRAIGEAGASRAYRVVSTVLWGGLALLIADAALAQDAAAAPEMTWLDFAKGWLRANAEYVVGPAVLPFVMAQARAWAPWLDKFGIISVLGNYLAGNYRHAKNAG